MADILTEIALDGFAKFILGLAQPKYTLQIGLFVNNYLFNCQTTIENLTECSCPGYQRITLDPTKWTGGTVVCDSFYQYPPQLFALTGNGGVPVTVYGHFFVDRDSESVLWGSNWLAPWVVPATAPVNPAVTPTW